MITRLVRVQDGSYLAELLIAKGYIVHGIIRRSSSFNTGRIAHLFDNPVTHSQKKMILHYGDLTDSTCLVKIITEVRPTEVYNLGAMSHVKVSFDMAEYTGNVDGKQVHHTALHCTARVYPQIQPRPPTLMLAQPPNDCLFL